MHAYLVPWQLDSCGDISSDKCLPLGLVVACLVGELILVLVVVYCVYRLGRWRSGSGGDVRDYSNKTNNTCKKFCLVNKDQEEDEMKDGKGGAEL